MNKHHVHVLLLAAVAPALVAPERANAGEPAPVEVLQRYDRMMSPRNFDALMVMVAHRQDDTTRTYKFRALKLGDDKIRLWFLEPASAKGQEMLRVGDNMWVYMPNLKRALRLASRESFQGGDFNNGDALRVNYVADYEPRFADSGHPSQWLLELTAKTKDAGYDRIKLWIRKADEQPIKAEYFATSGKLMRSMTFADVKDFRGHKRPSQLQMRNELASKRWSEMNMLDMKLDIEPPPQMFVVDALGR